MLWNISQWHHFDLKMPQNRERKSLLTWRFFLLSQALLRLGHVHVFKGLVWLIVPPWWRLDSWKHGEKKAWCTREELCNVDGPALNLTASNYTQLDANSTSTTVHVTLQSFTQSLLADTVHWLWAAFMCKSEEISTSPSSSPKQGAVVHSHRVWTGTEWRWGDHSFIAFSVSAPPTSSDLVRLFLLFLKPLVHFTDTS